MAAPDYAAALDLVPDVSFSHLADVLVAAAAPLAADEIGLYLADFQGVVLQPVLDSSGGEPGFAGEEVAGSMAGRAYRTGEAVVAPRDGSVRIWVPLVERGERTGVLVLTVPEATDGVVADCMRLGRFAGLVVRSFARNTDLLHLRRRRRAMTLAAGMQWDLLPPLTVRYPEGLVCGRLEPAYEIAGDAFDYVVNHGSLHAAVFDGMGHGVQSTLMTTLAVGAYRHARRGNEPLHAIHSAVDKAVAAQYGGDAFVTAAFASLDLGTGRLEWVNAGHPAPLLLRTRSIVRPLACAPSLPLGLGGDCREVASEALEPGDCVLFFTDGVVEGRSHTGEEYGVDRLVDAWERQAASLEQPDEILRRLVEEVLAYNARKLRDDASLMLVNWNGGGDALAPPEPA